LLSGRKRPKLDVWPTSQLGPGWINLDCRSQVVLFPFPLLSGFRIRSFHFNALNFTLFLKSIEGKDNVFEFHWP